MLDRSIKVAVIRVIGDLCLSLQKESMPYLGQIINISESCFEAVYQLSSTNLSKHSN